MLERKESEGVHKGPRPIIQPFEIHVAAKTWITLKNLSIKKFASRFHKKTLYLQIQIEGKGCYFLTCRGHLSFYQLIGEHASKLKSLIHVAIGSS